VNLCEGYYNHHLQNFDKIINEFKSKEAEFQTFFVQQLTAGPKMDEASAKTVAAKFTDRIEAQCLEQAKSIFTSTLNAVEKATTRLNIQQFCDSKFLAASETPEKALAYVRSPFEYFGKEFEQRLTTALSAQDYPFLTQSQHKILQVASFLGEMRNFVELKIGGQTVADIFTASSQSHGGSDAALSEISAAKERMAIDLFCRLCGEVKNVECVVKGLQLTQKVSWEGFEPAQQPDPVMLKLITSLLQGGVVQVRVNSLTKFIAALQTELTTFATKLMQKKYDWSELDTENKISDLERKAVGCKERCPCCGRVCDMDHSAITDQAVGFGANKHKCYLGHQFRAMIGYYFEKTKFASIKFCEDIRPNDEIIHKSQRYCWEDFKNRHPTWEFSSPVSASWERNRSSSLVMWKKVGKLICDEVQMKYTEKDESTVEPKHHYILVLDDSGSMQDDWNGLKDAVRGFLAKKQNAFVEHLVSCVIFNSHARIVFHNAKVSQELLSKIEFTSGGTNFSDALQKVISLVNASNGGDSDIVILFMSDGEDKYPGKEMQQLSACLSKIEAFWAIGFKGDSATLKQMAAALPGKGEYKNPTNISDLIQQYAEIADKS